jgi:hypothetical protein
MQDECVCYWGTFLFDHYIASIASSFVELGIWFHNRGLECFAAEYMYSQKKAATHHVLRLSQNKWLNYF